MNIIREMNLTQQGEIERAIAQAKAEMIESICKKMTVNIRRRYDGERVGRETSQKLLLEIEQTERYLNERLGFIDEIRLTELRGFATLTSNGGR